MDILRRRKRSGGSQRPVLVVAASDFHFNSTVAVSPDVWTLDDGGTWYPSPTQQWLNDCFKDFKNRIAKLAKDNDAEIWFVSVGDLVEGDHHGTFQIVTKNPATQKRMAIHMIEPWVKMSRYTFFVRGTPAHVGKMAWMEDEIASDLAHDDDKIVRDGNRWSWWTLKLEAGGVMFTFAHHRRQNHLPWTMGGAANRLAAQTIYKAANAGHRIPDVVVRAHGHRFDESSGTHRACKVVFLPAWKVACEFVHRIAPDSIADIGGCWFLCQDGEYKWDKIIYPRKELQPWTPN